MRRIQPDEGTELLTIWKGNLPHRTGKVHKINEVLDTTLPKLSGGNHNCDGSGFVEKLYAFSCKQIVALFNSVDF